MNIKFKTLSFTLAMTLSLACSSVSAEETVKKPATQSATKVTYYDGDKARVVYIQPDLVMEITSSNLKSKVKNVDSGASTVVDSKTIKIHKVTDATIKSGLQKGEISSTLKTAGEFHLVYASGVNGGQLLAFPGNVIVKLDKSMDEAAVNTWAKVNNVKIIRKLDISIANFYVVESAPGLAALKLADSLRGQPGVLSTTPEIWSQLVKK